MGPDNRNVLERVSGFFKDRIFGSEATHNVVYIM